MDGNDAPSTAVIYMRHLTAQRDALAELANEMLASFTKSDAGYRARVGQVQIAKWQKRIEVASHEH
jgi:hypothetical protein